MQPTLFQMTPPTDATPTAPAAKFTGAYYTPPETARRLAAWLMQSPQPQTILEPAAGDGSLVAALLETIAPQARRPRIVAVESDPVAAETGRRRTGQAPNVEWLTGDFFLEYHRLRAHGGFDAVIANPPFVRANRIQADRRKTIAGLLFQTNGPTSGMTNLWAAFLHLAAHLLTPGGRLAFILPADILYVAYARPLRETLARRFESVTIEVVSPAVFPSIQQSVVCWLARGKRATPQTTANVVIRTATNESDNRPPAGESAAADAPPPAESPWIANLLPPPLLTVFNLARTAPAVARLGDFASVTGGVITGCNQFFLLTARQCDQLSAWPFVHPIASADALPQSLFFSKEHFKNYADNGGQAYLLSIPHPHVPLPPALADYLENGRRNNIHLQYKCRRRRFWAAPPTGRVSDAFLQRHIHREIRLVVNQAGALNDSTLHGVALTGAVPAETLAASWVNSLTLADCETHGRFMGGGVMQVHAPTAEAVALPTPTPESPDPETIAELLRRNRFEAAVQYADDVLLRRNVGLDARDVARLHAAWKRLRDHRLARRTRAASA